MLTYVQFDTFDTAFVLMTLTFDLLTLY